MLRIFLSVSYAIEDCIKYDTTSHSASSGTSTYVSELYELATSTDYDISLDATLTNGYNSHLTFSDVNVDGGVGRGVFIQNNQFRSAIDGTTVFTSFSSPFSIRWVRESTTLKIYLNGTLVETITDNYVQTLKYLKFVSWQNSKTLTWSNLKIKPL